MLTTIKGRLCVHLRTMSSSQDPLRTVERITKERYTVNYESNLPRELTTGCSATTGDTIGFFIQMHMDFSGELCNAHEHTSMQQQKQYVRADNNIFGNY